jgi:hypothetical protein
MPHEFVLLTMEFAMKTSVTKPTLFSSLFIALVLTCGFQAVGQAPDAAQRAQDLRVQLAEVQVREADLKARLAQLDEALKPENIERSLAGVGSTRPEELRESRRRQLQIEKDGVVAQLDILAQSHVNLDSAIATADALAYQQSARESNSSAIEQMLVAPIGSGRWIIASLVIVIALLGLGAAILFTHRRARIH